MDANSKSALSLIATVNMIQNAKESFEISPQLNAAIDARPHKLRKTARALTWKSFFSAAMASEAAVAIKASGGLSTPSKMPGYAISLPASRCNVGSALRKVARVRLTNGIEINKHKRRNTTTK